MLLIENCDAELLKGIVDRIVANLTTECDIVLIGSKAQLTNKLSEIKWTDGHVTEIDYDIGELTLGKNTIKVHGVKFPVDMTLYVTDKTENKTMKPMYMYQHITPPIESEKKPLLPKIMSWGEKHE